MCVPYCGKRRPESARFHRKHISVSAGSAAGSRHFIDPPHAEPIACRPVVHGCAISRVKSVHEKQRPSALSRVTEPSSGAELHPVVEAAGVAAGGPAGRPRRLAGRSDCQGRTPLPRSNQTLRVQQRHHRASARPFTSFTTADLRRLHWPLDHLARSKTKSSRDVAAQSSIV